jgi:predicted AAA+ superfamily ATPase
VYRSIRPRGPLDRPAEIDGAALEGLVAQHLRAWIAYSGADAELFYWRTRAGAEVDFVIYGKDAFLAIEVKNAARIHPQDMRALKAFVTDYPKCNPVLLHRGRERLLIQDIWCIPVEQYLRELHPSALPSRDCFQRRLRG